MRVNDLAKELGVPAKDLLTKLKELGIEAKAAVSGLEDAAVARVRKAYDGGGKKPAAAKKAAPAKKSAAPAKAAPKGKAAAKAAPKGKKSGKAPAAAHADHAVVTELISDEEQSERDAAVRAVHADELEGFAPAAGGDAEPSPVSDDELADDDEDAVHERVALDAAGEVADVPAEPMTEEEQELSALYGEELGGAPAKIGEFADQRTRDEDRPMMPEINARDERNKRWEQRRDELRSRRDQEKAERKRRREEREKQQGAGGAQLPLPQGQGQPQGHGQPQGQGQPRRDGRDFSSRDRDHRDAPGGGGPGPGRELRELPHGEPRAALPPGPTPAEAAQVPDGTHVVHRVGNSLGDAAWQVFASLKNSQPMPVRQLAQMMRKRGLVDADPEQLWPHLKAALLGDERSYRGLGLRPRIVYRGRDLFAPGPVALSSTANAEAGVANALSSLAVATHRALKERIAKASHQGFERLIHAYLVSVGYSDIDWIKRVAGISYATAMPPDGSSGILVSARSGDQPVDRRGIGELRVGVEAKNLLAGLLFAARELSPESERELERPGRSITVLCGDALVSALLQSGVGVVTVAAPLRYVDDQMLDELLAG